MFVLGDKLREVFDKLSGKKFITEDTLSEVAKEVQKALIVSDVNLNLVLDVSKKIKGLKGEKVPEGLEEKEFIVKRIYDLLVELFSVDAKLPVKPKKILLCGLFGSGKTTTAIKLAKYYTKKRFSVGIIGADTYRMAAFEQLKQFGSEFEVFGNISKSASETVKKGLEHFKNKDIVIIDSAGRSALDGDLRKELEDIVKVADPEISLLVMSADIGQIALKQANEFNSIFPLAGIVLTKMDGSAKGGGALAACSSIKIPVVFIGTGEKMEDLQEFDATRYLSSVMGYGDLKGLLDKMAELDEKDLDLEEFNFDTFKKQLGMTKKIGSIGKLAGMLGFGKMMNAEATELAQKQMNKFGYIIDSMTPYEKTHPDSLNSSRIKRIANGAGVTVNDVNLLIKQYKTMRDTFDNLKGKDVSKFGEKDVQGLFKKQIQKKMKKKIKLK